MLFRRAKVVPRSQELVFLDADDDLGTIRSKLESSSAEEIYLVIPRRSSVLSTPLEFRIVARAAVRVAYPLMHVTLVPQTTTITRSVDVTIDPDVKEADPAAAVMPAQLPDAMVDASDSVPIPSDRTIGQDRAHGEVVITSR